MVNKYTYNYKELNEDFGLNWHDYGARWYDAALGRLWVVDPLAEPQANYSPYAYTYNNPLSFIDPTGMMGESADGMSNDQWLDRTRKDGGYWERAKKDMKINTNRAIQDLNGNTRFIGDDDLDEDAQVTPYGTRVYINGLMYRDVLQGYYIDKSKAIAEKAMSYRGSTAWDRSTPRGYITKDGQSKCNMFVGDVIEECGAYVEKIPDFVKSTDYDPNKSQEWNVLHGHFNLVLRYPTSHEWADPTHVIKGWRVLGASEIPSPGDVVAQVIGHDTHHVGIVVGPNATASVTTMIKPNPVVINDWGFRDEQKGQVTFRRYVGNSPTPKGRADW